MEYLIREMTIDDILDVVHGEEEVFKESLGYDMIYSDLKLNPYAYYFVLEIDEKVSGYIGLWIDGLTADVINFYILPKYQSMGFGKMMFEFALELCKMSNIQSISLEVRESNIKAIHLYEKEGLSFSHKRERYYKDGEDALVYIKKFEVKK